MVYFHSKHVSTKKEQRSLNQFSLAEKKENTDTTLADYRLCVHIAHLGTIQIISILFYLYSTGSQQQPPKGVLYCKV